MTRNKGLLASLLGTRPRTYQAGRLLGDLNAVARGPVPVVKRLVRKSAYKAFSKTLRRLGL